MKYKDFKQMSNDEMKNITGGLQDGQCSLSCGCSPNTSACNSANGNCQRDPLGAWIKCDGIPYDCPKPCAGA